jgi:hypothetical protein
MDHLGFISAVYLTTFGVIIALVAKTLKQGHDLSKKVADKDKPWT